MESGWTDAEVHYLISIWADEEIQALLESAKRNKVIFERIAKDMAKAGYNKTAEQCRDKIKKLKTKYKKVRDVQQTSGAGRQDWPFFDEMDAVLGTRHATEPPVVIDTSTAVQEESEEPAADKEKEASKEDSADEPGPSQSSPRKEPKGKSPLKKIAKSKKELVVKCLKLQLRR